MKRTDLIESKDCWCSKRVVEGEDEACCIEEEEVDGVNGEASLPLGTLLTPPVAGPDPVKLCRVLAAACGTGTLAATAVTAPPRRFQNAPDREGSAPDGDDADGCG